MNRFLKSFIACICLLVLFVQAGWAADEYTLTLNTQPSNAGSLNRSSGQTFAVGASVYMYYNANTDYVFDYWMSGDTIVSRDRYFYFIMPDHDATLTAVFHYDPTSPGNPNSPDQTKKYTLTLKTQPANAGSFNRSSGEQFKAGESIYMYGYNNDGFKFEKWMSADTVITTNRNFYFTMPAHDAELTAVYGYDPGSPANPDTAQVYYNVTLETQPANAGSFSWNSTTKVVARSSCEVYAYPNTDFTFKEWRKDGETVGTDRRYSFQMPAENIRLVAVYDYNPTNPSNPNKNYWNAETGEVIVDDFTAGNLSSEVNNTIGGSNNREKVQMITVAGPVSQYDWGVVNNYSNCTYLDMSRTYGMTYVPSYNFSNNTTLTTVSLPSSIERIEYYAFHNCSNLSSISIYAATPPTIGYRAFEGIGDSIVYVPADALALYQEAEGWKDFTILPLAKEVSALEINLPESTDPSIYKDMYIELINTKSGQKQRYVITNRTTYTFNSLIHRTSYNVYLKNAQGDVLGEIDGIDIVDHDVSMTFESLKVPRDLTLKVLTPAGEDVTSQTTITWMDAKDTYLTKGNTLTGQMEGAYAKFHITLPQTLGMQYLLPKDSVYEVLAENDISITLKAIPQTTIGGKVTDIKTGRSLSGAIVAISQMLNGLYSKSFTTKTDKKGEWSLQVYEAKTDITASMTDYVSKTQSFETLVAEVPAFELKDINGTTIAITLTYQPTGGELQEFYSDYANVAYTVYNETTQKQVTEMNVQYPQIVLMEQLAEGTQLRITATSKNQKFVPVTATATVDSLDRASVTLPIVQLGGITASFRQTDNPSVVGILYDGNGRLLKKYEYTSATLNINELQDGRYTLVTMASTQLFSTVGSLSQFAEAGLREGVDYVKNNVTVQSGEMAQVNNQLIPFLDETKLYYTDDGTSISVNKTEITTGNYLTISSHLNFKSAYANQVSDVKLIVDLPENCSFVDNSVMRGAQTSTYTYADGQVVVPLDYYSERVRFCFIPTNGGSFTATGSVQFTLNGKTITQPIGNAKFTVKDLSISVPSTVAKATMSVSGAAPGKSSVEIYDDGMLIGSTTSLANGTWSTTCELNEPYNLSTHNIYAKVTTKAGMELLSETKQVVYDKTMVVPEKVTMLYYNPEFVGQYNIVFDLINGGVSPKSYYFFPYKSYPNWWGSGTEPKDFTFIADLSNNDSTAVNGVTIRVYTDNGYWRNLEAQYNTSKNRWVAVSQFVEEEAPVGVEVEIDANIDYYIDANVFEKGFEGTKDLQEIIESSTSLTNELASKITNLLDSNEYSTEEVNVLMEELLGTINYNETISLNDKSVSDLLKETESLLSTDFTGLFSINYNNFEEISNYLYGFSIERRDDLNEESLVNEGFQKINCTDGKEYFYKYTDNEYIIAYLPLSIYIVYNLQDIENDASLSRTRRANDVTDLTTWQGKVNLLCDKLNTVVSAVTNAVDGVINQVDALKGKCQVQISENLGKLLQNAEEPFLTQKEINDLTKANAKLSKQIKQCEAISNWLSKNLKNFRVSNGAGVAFSLFDVYSITQGIKDDGNEIINLYFSVPDCPKDTNDDNLRNRIRNWGIGCFMFYAGKLAADIVQINSVVVGVTGAVPTGGTSLSAVGIALGIAAASFAAELAYSWQFEKNKERFENEISRIKCKDDDKCPRCGKNPCVCKDKCPKCGNKPCTCPNKCPKCGKNPCVCPPPSNKTVVQHDPSGYVYEGVASNRLQGVMASCYYKETVEDMYGDLHDNVVLWNAEDYAQENPLFTDEYGMYRWDVPKGLWQVKFEKEGYQTTYSEWLPVPPPQLEVNIPMTQMLQPTVKSGKAYSEGVEIEFDKYMDPSTLTTSNIMLTKNGNAVSGTIELLNEEVAYEGQTETFASKVRFNVPEGEELLSTDEVQLTVKNAVKSYAGVTMQDDYVQKFDVEPRVRLMAVDSLINVGYGAERIITVAALPADASKGKKVNVKSLSTMIAAVNSEELTLDENGQAELKVSGELPGSTVLNYKMEDSDVEGLTTVNVKDAALLVTIAPRASRVSGTEVYRGTKVQLSSETEGAAIYYTLDGSCPCNTETAIKYDADAPIVINDDNVTIKAMAQGHDLAESDVVEFNYSLKTTTLGYTLPVGWTWISHNEETAVPVSEFQAGAERIVSQTQELINDPVAGFIGSLTELQPVVGYKVKQATEGNVRLNGYEWDATKQTVAVETGWNWIGYPINQIMTVAEALAFFTPVEGDYLVSQNGYVEYADGEWKGTLEGMKPGEGFLYKSSTATEITFNTTIVSTAGNRAFKRSVLMGSPWAANSHAYPNIMPMTAQLYDNGMRTSDGEYIVGAFVGSECRGVGQWKEGRLMMNIYGTGGEELSSMAYNPQTEQMFNINETFKFVADNQGSWHQPCMLTIGSEATGISISNLSGDFTVTPLVARDHITVTAGGNDIHYLTLTDMSGRIVTSLRDLGAGATVTISTLPEGVYIVTAQAGGQTHYRKIVKSKN